MVFVVGTITIMVNIAIVCFEVKIFFGLGKTEEKNAIYITIKAQKTILLEKTIIGPVTFEPYIC